MRTRIIVLLVLAQQLAFAQAIPQCCMPIVGVSLQNNHKIDSLKKIIETGEPDTSQVMSLCLMSWYHVQLKNDSGVIYSRKALSLAEQLKNFYCIVVALRYIGNYFYYNNNYDSANIYWQKGLAISIAHNFYYEELYNFRVALNNNFFLSGNYPAAKKMSIDGLAKAEKINDRERMAHFNNVLGYILMRQQNFEESRNYYSTNLSLTHEIKNKVLEGNALLSLADLYVAENNLTPAARLIYKALDIFKATKLTYFPYERQAYSYNKLAEVNKLLKINLDALHYSLLAINISKKADCNKYDIASYYINAGDIFNRLKIPDSAIMYLTTGLHIAQNIIHREYMRDAYKQLSIAYAQKKIFESAYSYLQLYFIMQDSIAVESNQREILQRNANFKIDNQKQLQSKAIERQKFLRNIIIGIAVFFIFILILSYNYSRLQQQRKFQAELNSQQQEILRTTINVQDRERKRIAEDLHDSLGSILSAAKLKLSAAEEDSPSDSAEKEKLKDIMLLMDEALSEMKNIAYNIMPATLSRLGLTAALQNLFNRITTKSSIKINYVTYGFTERLDETTEQSIYRIILESTNNVIKHAVAKNITVQLLQYPDYINITIEDDGIGFDLDEKIYAGNGLSNIASRVKSLKGTINMDSKQASGTTFLIDIPYKKNES